MTQVSQSHPDPIMAYCVRDKTKVEMESPEAVFTSRGMPGTRGTCPICGGSVFRMGATDLHEGMQRPEPVKVTTSKRRQKPKLEPNTVYVAYASDDEEAARQLATDLTKIGLPTWMHDHEPETVKWAGGVHPALKDCTRMVVVLSAAALADEQLATTWQFFKAKRKPVVVAQLGGDADVPDAIRRSARFDIETDYRGAFRQMVQALSR